MTGARAPGDDGERLPPWRTFLASDDAIRDLLRGCRTFAIVGDLADPDAPRRLAELGYRVVRVAGADEIRALDEPAETVVVCDPTLAIEPLAEAARAIGAHGLWLERGVTNPRAALFAARLDLVVAMDRSILAECAMHFPDDEVGYP